MEKVIGFLEQVSGHTYDTIYDLVFTNERVIAVIVQHPSDEIHKLGLRGLLLGGRLAKGRNRPGRMGIAEERRRDYEEKAFDELMTSHRFNFEICYNNVSSVEITRRLFKSHLKFRISRPSVPVFKIHFTLDKNQFSNTKQLLDLAFKDQRKLIDTGNSKTKR